MSTDTTFGVEVQHELSTKSLSQFSGASADAYTNYVASIMCKELKPGPQGQRMVNSALANLPIFFTPDEKLTFGWGLDNIIRNNVVHPRGYEHLGIMMALAESFHTSWAAEICHEMAKSIAGPNDSLPHLAQWQANLRSCNGVLASTDFAVSVEDFIRLDPYSLNFGINKTKRNPISPKEIVSALHALAAVVKGSENQLTVTGSAILGWFAAVAESLYDLNVAIFSSEGESLSGTKTGEDPQVRIIYREKAGIEVSSNTKPQGITHAMSHMGLTSQQYARSVHSIPLSGRVVWQSLLPRVFGISFGHLDREKNREFSGMIGSAARMFEGLALGESAEAEDLVSAQNKSNPASYGAGFVQTLTAWLPELRRFQGRMERALKLDYNAASDAFVENLTKLREACHCGICFSKPGDENEGQGPTHGYCLVVITEAIIAMCLALSRITVAAQIFPSRAGIQQLYAAQAEKRLEARGRRWQDHFRIIYGSEWNGSATRRLQTAAALFSGSMPTSNLPENLLALAHEGIVAYILKLEKSSPKKEEEAIIRVSSGHINVRQKIFKRACMGPVENSEAGDLWEAVDVEHLAMPLYCK